MITHPRRATRAAALALGIVAATATTATADSGWTATDARSVSLTGQWSTTDHSGTRLQPRPQRRAETTSRQQRRTDRPSARRSAFFRPNSQCRPARGGIWRVRQGDTLDLITRCTGTTAAQLAAWNHGLIRGTTVYAGSRLAISTRAAARAAEQRAQGIERSSGGGSW